MWEIIATSLLLCVFAYVGFAALLYVRQGSLVYFPGSLIESTPADIGLDYRPIAFHAGDGVALTGWFVPAEKAKGVILFCHGNGGNISHRLDSLLVFHGLGYAVFIFDYRGYGRSEGRPTEEGTYQDAEAAWRYLTGEKGIAPGEIVLFGRSLGGAVAARLAENHQPRACILESTPTSVPDMAAELYPYLPVRLLSRFQYDALSSVRRRHCPLLVVHSPDDEIVPFAQGRRLYDEARPPKSFLEIRGDHNSGFLTSGDLYLQGLSHFLLVGGP